MDIYWVVQYRWPTWILNFQATQRKRIFFTNYQNTNKTAAGKEIILKLWKIFKNLKQIRTNFSGRHKPNNRTIRRVLATCTEGKCSLKKVGVPRVKRALIVVNLHKIEKSVKENNKLRVRRRCREVAMTRSSCARGLKVLGFKPYIKRIRLDLKLRNNAQRLECAKHFLALMEANPAMKDSLGFTDENFFTLLVRRTVITWCNGQLPTPTTQHRRERRSKSWCYGLLRCHFQGDHWSLFPRGQYWCVTWTSVVGVGWCVRVWDINRIYPWHKFWRTAMGVELRRKME